MAKLVLTVLALFSIISWGFAAERFLRFRRAERESRLFLDRFEEGGGLASIHDDTADLQSSPLAAIFAAGFREISEISLNPAPEGDSWHGEQLAALERVLRKSASAQLTDLERSLGFLATTASATPFIGLFGTVWGIMNAFRSRRRWRPTLPESRRRSLRPLRVWPRRFRRSSSTTTFWRACVAWTRRSTSSSPT